MSGPPRPSTLSTTLRIYQETFGVDDASLIAKSVDGAELARVQRGEIDSSNLEVLGQIAGAMGVATGDLLADPLDPLIG